MFDSTDLKTKKAVQASIKETDSPVKKSKKRRAKCIIESDDEEDEDKDVDEDEDDDSKEEKMEEKDHEEEELVQEKMVNGKVRIKMHFSFATILEVAILLLD